MNVIVSIAALAVIALLALDSFGLLPEEAEAEVVEAEVVEVKAEIVDIEVETETEKNENILLLMSVHFDVHMILFIKFAAVWTFVFL